MDRCFVIQPFDGGPFDKRFADVLSPAIAKLGMEAYRVDQDPTVTVPVDAIEGGIRDAMACVADITTDNPNVWFELGFAFACVKPVVLICSTQRTSRFPFDIQHRHVITYRTESSSDFAKLGAEIESRLGAAIARESKVKSLSEGNLRETEGLEPHEIAALVIVAESDLDPESSPSEYSLKNDMKRAGYTEIATVLAVNSLLEKGLVGTSEVQPYNGDTYRGYCLVAAGRGWLSTNRDRLRLTVAPKPANRVAPKSTGDDFSGFPGALEDDDDELPF